MIEGATRDELAREYESFTEKCREETGYSVKVRAEYEPHIGRSSLVTQIRWRESPDAQRCVLS
jgi:hypothetical protein